MASLVHKVQFEDVPDMVIAIAEIYSQFEPRGPVPKWWERFAAWVAQQEIEEMADLEKRVQEACRDKSRPDWWELAEQDFNAAPSVKQTVVKTEPFSADFEYEDDENQPAGDDEEPSGDEDEEKDEEQDDGEEEGDGEDGDGEDGEDVEVDEEDEKEDVKKKDAKKAK